MSLDIRLFSLWIRCNRICCIFVEQIILCDRSLLDCHKNYYPVVMDGFSRVPGWQRALRAEQVTLLLRDANRRAVHS